MITVIGAGPAGCFYASKEQSDEVHIFEEHSEVGRPISCTGILTDSIKKVIDIKDELVVSRINEFKIIAPDQKTTYVKLKNANLVIDRARFDQYMLEKAFEKGAKLHLNERFLSLKKFGNEYKIKTNKSLYHTQMIVGADGPHSEVAKAAGIYGRRRFVHGLQARCEYPDLEQGVCTVHLNLGEFSWIVPEDDKIARVGVIGPLNEKLRNDYKKLLNNTKILESQSGVIPIYSPHQKLRKGNIFLIGDAATQVKATTYGGVIFGTQAAQFLAADKDSYEKEFNKKLGRELWLSLKMRDLMNNMDEKQANDLVKIFQKKSNNDILAQFDRDYPSKFILRLMVKEPQLWKLGLNILRNKIFGKH